MDFKSRKRVGLRTVLIALGLMLANSQFALADLPPPPPGPIILRDLKSFGQLGGVLHVAAHPDDENTQLLTYFALGRNMRTAYLSVTRGDGGQNVIGPEFGDDLGVIRTQELLAGRRLDGAIQFFTRATDFGFSKSAEEALRIWNREAILGDVVRVFRTFRPDVVVTRFNPDTGGTHGHHTASAILSREAFALAGDPTKYPEQLTPAGGNLTVWQPKRILLNAGGGGGRGGGAGGGLSTDIGGTDAATGAGFGEISGRSRSMHRSQGFQEFGGRGGTGPVNAGFTLLAGEPAQGDILSGVDTTWGRHGAPGAAIAKLVEEAVAKFDPNNPAASVPALLEIKKQVAALRGLDSDHIVAERKLLLDRIIVNAAGISVETTVAGPEYVPGESVPVKYAAIVKSDIPTVWTISGPTGISTNRPTGSVTLKKGEVATQPQSIALSAQIPVSQPYWLRESPGEGMHKVAEPNLIGTAQNGPALPVYYNFQIGGQLIAIGDEPVFISGETRRRMEVVPPVTLNPGFDVRLIAPGATKFVEVELIANRPNTAGTLKLEVPAGWTVTPASQPFQIASGKSKLKFDIKAPAAGGTGNLRAIATVNGRDYSHIRKEISYGHIPFQLLQPAAKVKLASFDIATRGKKIGYIPGAGDSVAECIAEMGYDVTEIPADAITAEKLQGLDAVVIGVRAFDTRGADLAAARPALTAFVDAGGNLIAQYNRQGAPQVGPLTVRVANIRTTDENAKPNFLAPENPALTTPNKITAADFDNWVQERGIYYPQSWDEAFTPILAFADPGEQPANGPLLVAKHGKGHVVYTSLVFFRELPAGVPGAYRLFANLVSLGKQ